LIGRPGRGHPDAANLGDVLDELDHARDRGRIDVLDDELGLVEHRRVREVGQQLRHPLVAAASDDRDARCHQAPFNATVSSTSTGAPRGSAATPMAERVCRPAGPKTCSSTRLAPSATDGCSTKSSAHAMKTVMVSVRSIRSSEPIDARNSDSALSAHNPAECAASFVVSSRPTIPVAKLPVTSRGRQPDVRAVPAWITTPSSGSWGGNGPGNVRPSSSRRASYTACTLLRARACWISEPLREERIGALAVPPVPAVEDVVLEPVVRVQRRVHGRETSDLTTGRVDREDRI